VREDGKVWASAPAQESGTLWDTLRAFAERVNADERLRKMLAGWERLVRLEASDQPLAAAFRVSQGRVEVVPPEGEPDIVLRSDAGTLVGMFAGTLSPTEPYLDGTLTILGSQEDVLRLDLLSLMIWGD
jgi:putative sterol carrier protein